MWAGLPGLLAEEEVMSLTDFSLLSGGIGQVEDGFRGSEVKVLGRGGAITPELFPLTRLIWREFI